LNTKFDISLERVEELVQAQFPSWAGLPIRPVKYGGWNNKTFHLSESIFRRSIGLADATWAQARGGALWKALLEVERYQHNHSLEGKNAHRTIKAILSEHMRLTN